MQETSFFLVICLNPTIQNTMVFPKLVPGEVNRSAECRVDASGKGVNVARTLMESGRPVVHLTQLGGPTRDWFLAMCAADRLEVSWVESASPIRICTTAIDRSAGTTTELVQEGQTVDAGTEERFLCRFTELLPGARAVLISGTKAAGFSPSTIPQMARLAARANKPLFLDIKGEDLRGCLPHRPFAIKPNLEELLQTRAPEKAEALRSSGDEGELRRFVAEAGFEYEERHGTGLVVTRGARPTLFWEGGRLQEQPTNPVAALNPIGSGDAFMAGLAMILTEGGSLAEAVTEGNRLGGLNAEQLKPGSIGERVDVRRGTPSL
ncbi:MAG: PfkB family carbohydrate kinase [Spirochaetota bacterium]